MISTIALAALHACGGSAGPAAPITKPVTACTALPNVTIQLFGDSTQAGYEGGVTPSRIAAHNPTEELQRILDAQFGAGSTLVVNRGVGGTRSYQLRAGTDGLNLPWPQSVAAQIIVVNHGINNMQDQATIPLSAYKADLEFFAANTNGAQLVLETPNVVTGWGLSGTALYAQAMRDVAAEHQLPVADTYDITDSSMLGDWAHPTDAGYVTIVAESLAPAVTPLVAKLLCR